MPKKANLKKPSLKNSQNSISKKEINQKYLIIGLVVLVAIFVYVLNGLSAPRTLETYWGEPSYSTRYSFWDRFRNTLSSPVPTPKPTPLADCYKCLDTKCVFDAGCKMAGPMCDPYHPNSCGSMPLVTPIPPNSYCKDGTRSGACSVTKPFYCYNGQLTSNCEMCGCATGYICNIDNKCVWYNSNEYTPKPIPTPISISTSTPTPLTPRPRATIMPKVTLQPVLPITE